MIDLGAFRRSVAFRIGGCAVNRGALIEVSLANSELTVAIS